MMRIAGVLLVGIAAVCSLSAGVVPSAASSPVSTKPKGSPAGSSAAWQTPAGPDRPADGPNVAWLLFVDDLHLDFVQTGRLRTMLGIAATTLRGDDGAPIGLHSSGPSGVVHGPSDDRSALDDATRRITGNGLRAGDILDGRVNVREFGQRAQTTLTALRAAIDGLAITPATHKHIVFISNGFTIVGPPAGVGVRGSAPQPLLPVDDEGLRLEIARVAEASRERGITISTLGPRRFYGDIALPAPIDEAQWQAVIDASRRNLQVLATATGGTLLDAPSLANALASLRARSQR